MYKLDMILVSCLDHWPSSDNDENIYGNKSTGSNETLSEPPGDFNRSDGATVVILDVGVCISVIWP